MNTNIKQKNFTTASQIDWLTLRINYIGGILELTPKFAYKILDRTTRVFQRVIEITDLELNEVVATITDMPVSNVMNEDLCLIKFHNKLLYNGDLKEYILNFCKENFIKILAISRVDIAVDFIRFANGLEPEKFIKRFLNNKYIKKGQGKGQANFDYGSEIQHQYLKFGSSNNGLKYYLYNKSKELNDVKYKPYIVNRWKEYGYNENSNTDVWRLEFSITSNDIRFIQNTEGTITSKNKSEVIKESFLIDTKTGEAKEIQEFNLKSLEIMDLEIQPKVWASLVNKYMVFYSGSKNRKDRNKKIQLFTKLPSYVAYTCERSLTESSNMDKNYVRNLRRNYEDLRNKDFYGIEQSKDILERVIKWQVDKRGLGKWANEKEILNFGIDSIYTYKADKTIVKQAKRLTEAEKTKKFNKDTT